MRKLATSTMYNLLAALTHMLPAQASPPTRMYILKHLPGAVRPALPAHCCMLAQIMGAIQQRLQLLCHASQLQHAAEHSNAYSTQSTKSQLTSNAHAV